MVSQIRMEPGTVDAKWTLNQKPFPRPDRLCHRAFNAAEGRGSDVDRLVIEQGLWPCLPGLAETFFREMAHRDFHTVAESQEAVDIPAP